MAIRFFMLQSHYRSTLDLTDEALLAAEKGYKRLMEGYAVLQELNGATGSKDSELNKAIIELIEATYAEMDDDFNTPKALARLFELVSKINGLKGGQLSMTDLSSDTLGQLKSTFDTVLFDILGLKDEQAEGGNNQALEAVMSLILDIRQDARTNKDWGTSDKIRDALKAAGIVVKDDKDGASWNVE